MATERGALRGAWALALLALGLPASYLSLYLARGYGFPVGSDAPVYLWWERLAALEGLSTVRMRAGMPALTLVLEGTLGISQAQALAALGVVAATSVGLGAAAWGGECTTVGGERTGTVAGLLAGVLAGTYAADMAGGYYANAVFAALFVAAIVLLLRSSRRAAAGAAVLLGAASLTHPLFAPLGLAILALAVAPAAIRRRGEGSSVDTETGRAAVAVLGAAGLFGLGSLALAFGPDPHAVDTSADAFRRRKGLFPELGRSYLDRFRRRLARYVLPVAVPLAWLGRREIRRKAGEPGAGGGSSLGGRLLASWGAITVVGVVFGAWSQRVPPARFLGFALVLPIGAAFGLLSVWRWLVPRVERRRGRGVALGLALLVCGGLAASMVAGATIPWRRQQPFLSPLEVTRATAAGEVAKERTEPGTPIVVVVDGAEPVHVPFLVARAANVVRASVPPDRIRDVFVYLGSAERYLAGEPTGIGDRQYDAFSRGLLEDIDEAVDRTGREPAAFVLAPFARPAFDEARAHGELAAPGVLALEGPAAAAARARTPAEPPVPALAPSSPAGIALATFSALVLLAALGYGWARAFVGATGGAPALAPAFGLAAMILAGIALERLGLPLTGSLGPVLVSAVAGGSGYAVALGLQRGRRTEVPA